MSRAETAVALQGDADADGPLSELAAVEERELSSFEHIDQFRSVLSELLASASPDTGSATDASVTAPTPTVKKRDKTEAALNPYQNASIAKLIEILSPYQEQPHLLDPYLDELVIPPVQAFQKLIRSGDGAVASLNSPRLQELAVLIYTYTKIRGDKVITRFFPHEVDDLLPVVTALEALVPGQSSSISVAWELRYVLVLWLSLVCMIPFDLRQLDEVASQTSQSADPALRVVRGTVAERIESLAKTFLASPGKERDAAAVLLGKLFQRRDLKYQALAAFLSWTKVAAHSTETTPFLQTGIMQALCEIIKVSDPASIETHLAVLQGLFESLDSAAQNQSEQQPNVLILRYEAKMACRLGLKLLKPRRLMPRSTTAKALDHNLKASDGNSGNVHDAAGNSTLADEEGDAEEDVPEEIDGFVAKLLSCLESKDTAVRYSAAKGIARLCERLPPSFVTQLTDAIRSLFAINVIEPRPSDGQFNTVDSASGLNFDFSSSPDLSNASEHTWQGACMAVAELARRGLLPADELDETMKWILRALTFDVRRGANSVGSAVRDAACYVLWALARAHANANAIRAHTVAIASELLIVATLDREVSVRRAASAAFQECVGRMGNIPHGIDVLRKTDFYVVGIRRNAFVNCASEVAMQVPRRHFGAQHEVYRRPLLRHLLTVTYCHWDRSMRTLAAQSIRSLVNLDFDGQAVPVARRLLSCIKRPDAFVVHGSLLALSQLAELCAEYPHSPTSTAVLQTCLVALNDAPLSVLRSTGAAWPLCAACELIRSTSSTCQQTQVEAHSSDQDWKGLHPSRQQSNALLLGSTRFDRYVDLFELTIRFLVSLLEVKGPLHSSVIEVRRNAVRSLDTALTGLGSKFNDVLSVELGGIVVKALLSCLEDYTVDQRGDVGSWVRIASLTTLRHYIEMSAWHSDTTQFTARIARTQLDEMLAGVSKQAVERIDAVRQHAGLQLIAIRASCSPLVELTGGEILDAALSGNDAGHFQDASWAFPRMITLLEVPVYRVPVLRGIATSLASKSDLANRIVGSSLSDWAAAEDGRFRMLLGELHRLGVANFGSNTTFVPVLVTMNVLIEGGAAEDSDVLEDADLAKKLCRICTQSADKMKSMARVQASAALCVNLLRLPSARHKVLDALPIFLLHSFTAVRSFTAEHLYNVLQEVIEDDVPEEVEEIILNTKWAQRLQKVQTPKLVELLTSAIPVES
ncbi:hypothetical protein OC846_000720 [Tilletia horrida]|uniref:Tubulin-specific chaperone D n=1 Tax=Tilletia horrida TaxID=155126 RepID=A0AAN6GVC9_9BASI|nr:hypothetical protein OC846_000720 [Tilletia horrida]